MASSLEVIRAGRLPRYQGSYWSFYKVEEVYKCTDDKNASMCTHACSYTHASKFIAFQEKQVLQIHVQAVPYTYNYTCTYRTNIVSVVLQLSTHIHKQALKMSLSMGTLLAIARSGTHTCKEPEHGAISSNCLITTVKGIL